MGLFSKFPPQFGQILFSLSLAQSLQKVHSNEQIIANGLSGGSAFEQNSHVDFKRSIRKLNY